MKSRLPLLNIRLVGRVALGQEGLAVRLTQIQLLLRCVVVQLESHLFNNWKFGFLNFLQHRLYYCFLDDRSLVIRHGRAPRRTFEWGHCLERHQGSTLRWMQRLNCRLSLKIWAFVLLSIKHNLGVQRRVPTNFLPLLESIIWVVIFKFCKHHISSCMLGRVDSLHNLGGVPHH